MPAKPNLFDDFEDVADKSEGLKSLAQTSIKIEAEPRRSTLITMATDSEAKLVRRMCADLSDEMDRRITVSNVGREFFRMMVGEDAVDPEIREEILKRLS